MHSSSSHISPDEVFVRHAVQAVGVPYRVCLHHYPPRGSGCHRKCQQKRPISSGGWLAYTISRKGVVLNNFARGRYFWPPRRFAKVAWNASYCFLAFFSRTEINLSSRPSSHMRCQILSLRNFHPSSLITWGSGLDIGVRNSFKKTPHWPF